MSGSPDDAGSMVPTMLVRALLQRLLRMARRGHKAASIAGEHAEWHAGQDPVSST